MSSVLLYYSLDVTDLVISRQNSPDRFSRHGRSGDGKKYVTWCLNSLAVRLEMLGHDILLCFVRSTYRGKKVDRPSSTASFPVPLPRLFSLSLSFSIPKTRRVHRYADNRVVVPVASLGAGTLTPCRLIDSSVLLAV